MPQENTKRFALALLLLAGFVSSSAEAKENPLFDSYYTLISIKAENARLDNYAAQLRNAPLGRAVIVVYAGSENTVRSAKARALRAVRYLVKTRGVDPSRVVWRYDAACGHEEILLYLLYPNEADPTPDTKCTLH